MGVGGGKIDANMHIAHQWWDGKATQHVKESVGKT